MSEQEPLVPSFLAGPFKVGDRVEWFHEDDRRELWVKGVVTGVYYEIDGHLDVKSEGSLRRDASAFATLEELQAGFDISDQEADDFLEAIGKAPRQDVCDACGTSRVQRMKFNGGDPAKFWMDVCLCAEKRTEEFVERLIARMGS